jgi:hypothetical protein
MVIDADFDRFALLNIRADASQPIETVCIHHDDDVGVDEKGAISLLLKRRNAVSGIEKLIKVRREAMVYNVDILPACIQPFCQRNLRAEPIPVGIYMCGKNECLMVVQQRAKNIDWRSHSHVKRVETIVLPIY